MKPTAIHIFSAHLFSALCLILAAQSGARAASPPGSPDNAQRPRRTPSPPAAAASLETALANAPALKQHILWIAGDGQRQGYDDWTPAMKNRIGLFYRRLVAKATDLQIRLPAEDKIDPHNGQAYFTAESAFDVYAAHVAHVLYVESHHLVPWSIAELPATQLEELLASSSYFARIRPAPGNTYPAGIQANRDFAETPENYGLGELIGDPRIGYDFLSGKSSASRQNLIAQTPQETLVNVTTWARDNLDHGPIDDQTQKREARQRWLEQRLSAGEKMHTAMAIQGCHSAAKLLVDLARSVNIPLLHARSLDPVIGENDGSLFSKSHGALIFGWGAPRPPLILWHVDEIYAADGRAFFPIDEHTGNLLPKSKADQLYFDEHWATPQTLAKAGFTYRLQRVIPGQGYGTSSRGQYEDRYDYGMVCGAWKKNGKSDLSEIYQLSHDYVLCGEPLLYLARQQVVVAQLANNIGDWRGGFNDADLMLLRPLTSYDQRANAALKALGGAAKFDRIVKEYEASRGSNLRIR